MFDARRKQNAIGLRATGLRGRRFSIETYQVFVNDQLVRFHVSASAPVVFCLALV